MQIYVNLHCNPRFDENHWTIKLSLWTDVIYIQYILHIHAPYKFSENCITQWLLHFTFLSVGLLEVTDFDLSCLNYVYIFLFKKILRHWFVYFYHRSSVTQHWLTDWLTDSLNDWLTDWLTHWLTHWLTDWCTDWLTTHSLTHWLTYCLTDSRTDSLTHSLTHSLTDSRTDWLTTHSLTDLLTVSLTHVLTDWLTDWVTNAFRQP